MEHSRQHPRHRQRFRVTVGRATLFTMNLGRGGFCAEILRVLPVGTTVEGAVRAAGQEFAYAGRVAWARSGDPRMNVRGRMGIRFTEVAPELLQVLESLPGAEPPGKPPVPGATRKR